MPIVVVIYNMAPLTKEEIRNCKDYKVAESIVNFWNKSDSEFGVFFDTDEINQGHIYIWKVGTIRWRMIRRAPWMKLAFCRY